MRIVRPDAARKDDVMRGGRRFSAIVLAMILGGLAGAQALYVRVETAIVPVARLAANLERRLQERPKDADLHVNLARLYAMAYSMNADELPAVSRNSGEEVWFGYEPPLLPKNPPAGKADRTKAAHEYLRTATDYFERALKLNPSHLHGRLGHAWALQQSGAIPAAIAEYRRVAEQAWPLEQARRGIAPGERFFTPEVAERLIPLLDPRKDAAEIETLTSRAATLSRLPRAITPIAIPLVDKATLRSIVDLDARVPFDADGSGLRRQWTWITDDAGWLVYDPTQRGRITSALQWFGNVTFWLFWNNGYDALAALDDDGDGELSGAELRYLAIWSDSNRNGLSDRGEVRPLSQFDVVALSYRYTQGDGILAAARSDQGVRLTNGRTRPTYDVILRRSSAVSAPPPQHE
jgi:hypothetical protein